MAAVGGQDGPASDSANGSANGNGNGNGSDPEIVRGVDAGRYLETLLITAVAAVLAIRAFLILTGFPQIGGGGLHIAHVLWGGLLMLVALVLAVAFLGARARWLAAAVGGIGFGTFIDEVGKFVTADNDYFFRPAVAIIYVVFLALFFAFRRIISRVSLSPRARLANAADGLSAALVDDGGARRVEREIALVEPLGSSDPVAPPLAEALRAARSEVGGEPTRITRAVRAVRHAFDRFVRSRFVQRAVVALFVAVALASLVYGAVTLVRIGLGNVDLLGDERSFFAVGDLAAAIVAAGFVVVGFLRLRSSRADAYRWFRRAVLVQLLLVQVFLFYEDQLAAVGGVALNLLLLAVLEALIEREASR